MALHRAVFLDRDGTLNAPVVREGKPYPPSNVEEFRLLEGVAESCAKLHAAGYVLIVATNQPDVGRGTRSREAVEAVHARLRLLLPSLARIEVCYASGEEIPASADRKPAPGMLLRAARELGLDLSRSWMIGDRWRDVDCGHNAGLRTIFIDWGYEEKLRTAPDFIVTTFSEAAGIILAHTQP